MMKRQAEHVARLVVALGAAPHVHLYNQVKDDHPKFAYCWCISFPCWGEEMVWTNFQSIVRYLGNRCNPAVEEKIHRRPPLRLVKE